MKTHFQFAVILGTFPKKRNNENLVTVRKIKIEKQKQNRSKNKRQNDTQNQTFSSFNAKQRLQPQDWERTELKHWGKCRLPYMSNVNKNFSNTETLTLVRLNVETCSRISQAC